MKLLKKRWVRLIGAVMPFLILGALYMTYPSDPVTLIPEACTFTSYSDQESRGASQCEIEVVKDSIQFSFRLKEGVQYPYAGFEMRPDSSINLASYNEVSFEFQCLKATEVPVSIVIPNYTWEDNRQLELRLRYYFKPIKGSQTVTIPLKEFQPPEWWIKKNNVPPSLQYNLDGEIMTAVYFENGRFTSIDQPDTFLIRDVTLRHNVDHVFMISAAGLFVLEVVAWLMIVFFKSKKVEVVPVHYEPKEVVLIVDEQHDAILAYIKSNYSDQITAKIIQVETGIPSSKVLEIIKSKYDITLSQFVSRIRLEEAKRLLIETDLPVNEISDIIGFGNISHFNRVFKNHHGESPSAFRKKVN